MLTFFIISWLLPCIKLQRIEQKQPSAQLRRTISPCQAVGCNDKEQPINSLDPTGRQASDLEISAGVVLGLGVQVHPTSKRRLTA